MKTIRKACVQAVFDEFETQGEIVHPFKDGDAEAMRPNYALRRVKFAAAVVGLVVSVTLMLTWHGGGLTGALVVEGVYLATALWLTVRFASRDDVDGDV